MIIIGYSEAFMSVELMTVGALSGLGKDPSLQCHQHYTDQCENPAGNTSVRYGTGTCWGSGGR